MSLLSSSSKRVAHARESGFTLVEMLIAAAVMVILLSLIGNAIVSTLKVKSSETQMVEVQQNLRSALQLISQDLRAGAFLHLWHDSSCATGDVCSNSQQIAVITTDGTMTTIPEPPGSSYNNSAITGACDAREFDTGDVALVYNNGTVDLIEITGINLHANYSQPCKGPPGTTNRDQIQHNKDKISGQWSASSYIYKAVLATYSLEADPLDADRTVLYRRTGLNTPGNLSGVVAFGVDELEFGYGVPVDPTAAASQLIFYSTLEDAATALGGAYSADPRATSAPFVGTLVEAVRVRMEGATRGANGQEPRTFELTETVELRR